MIRAWASSEIQLEPALEDVKPTGLAAAVDPCRSPEPRPTRLLDLCDVLDGSNMVSDGGAVGSPELQQEHDVVQRIKGETRIIAILGNPPYDRFAGVPVAEEADRVDHYKGIKRDHKGQQLGRRELFTQWGRTTGPLILLP